MGGIPPVTRTSFIARTSERVEKETRLWSYRESNESTSYRFGWLKKLINTLQVDKFRSFPRVRQDDASLYRQHPIRSARLAS